MTGRILLSSSTEGLQHASAMRSLAATTRGIPNLSMCTVSLQHTRCAKVTTLVFRTRTVLSNVLNFSIAISKPAAPRGRLAPTIFPIPGPCPRDSLRSQPMIGCPTDLLRKCHAQEVLPACEISNKVGRPGCDFCCVAFGTEESRALGKTF